MYEFCLVRLIKLLNDELSKILIIEETKIYQIKIATEIDNKSLTLKNLLKLKLKSLHSDIEKKRAVKLR